MECGGVRGGPPRRGAAGPGWAHEAKRVAVDIIEAELRCVCLICSPAIESCPIGALAPPSPVALRTLAKRSDVETNDADGRSRGEWSLPLELAVGE